MRIITEGEREVLMDRIQCMRDTNEALRDTIEDMIEQRAICCGQPVQLSSSSSSSSLPSSSSSS